jgi:hypothetical protein
VCCIGTRGQPIIFAWERDVIRSAEKENKNRAVGQVRMVAMLCSSSPASHGTWQAGIDSGQPAARRHQTLHRLIRAAAARPSSPLRRSRRCGVASSQGLTSHHSVLPPPPSPVSRRAPTRRRDAAGKLSARSLVLGPHLNLGIYDWSANIFSC